MISRTKTIIGILWKRLPSIALYFLTFLIMFYGIDFVLNKWVLPTSWYVRDYTMTVTNTTEHRDVPYKVCRDRRGDFIADGVRTISIIPEGKSESDKVFSGNYEITQAAIDGDRCENNYIRLRNYDHKAGRYIATTTLRFTTKYDRHHTIVFKSNIYEIFQENPTDLNRRISEIAKELKRLKAIQKGDASTQSKIQTQSSSELNAIQKISPPDSSVKPGNSDTGNGSEQPIESPETYSECVSKNNGLLNRTLSLVRCINRN